MEAVTTYKLDQVVAEDVFLLTNGAAWVLLSGNSHVDLHITCISEFFWISNPTRCSFTGELLSMESSFILMNLGVDALGGSYLVGRECVRLGLPVRNPQSGYGLLAYQHFRLSLAMEEVCRLLQSFLGGSATLCCCAQSSGSSGSECCSNFQSLGIGR